VGCSSRSDFVCQHCGVSKPGPTEFKVYAGNATLWEAEAACVEDGGHLASIHSESDRENIASIGYGAGSSIWIGLHDSYHEAGCNGRLFVWTDGTETDFMAWSTGEPNDWQEDLTSLAAACSYGKAAADRSYSIRMRGASHNEDCAAICEHGVCEGHSSDGLHASTGMNTAHNTWFDTSCDSRRAYVCGYNPTWAQPTTGTFDAPCYTRAETLSAWEPSAYILNVSCQNLAQIVGQPRQH
jgi:hypothetical protein